MLAFDAVSTAGSSLWSMISSSGQNKPSLPVTFASIKVASEWQCYIIFDFQYHPITILVAVTCVLEPSRLASVSNAEKLGSLWSICLTPPTSPSIVCQYTFPDSPWTCAPKETSHHQQIMNSKFTRPCHNGPS